MEESQRGTLAGPVADFLAVSILVLMEESQRGVGHVVGLGCI